MAKRETKETYNDVKTDQNKSEGQHDNAAEQNANETTQSGSSLGGDRASVEGGYQGLMSNPTAKVGEISKDQYNPIMAGYQDIGSNGGYSPESKSNIQGDIAGLRSMGANGGIDADSMNKFRGNGVFDEFSQTGGLSAGDRANIKSRALSPISANASATRDELARRNSVQGGFSPGFDSASRALRRDTARGIADTSLNANLGIMDQVNAGRQWGASGASGAESSLQGLRTGNQYRGLMGASGQEMNLNNSITGNRLSGLGGGLNTAGAMSDVDRTNAGIQSGNIQNQQEQQYRGIQGMQGLYNTDLNRYTGALDRGVGIIGQQAGTQQGYYGARNPLAMQPGVGGNIMQGVGMAAGVGGALLSGGASRMNPLITNTARSI